MLENTRKGFHSNLNQIALNLVKSWQLEFNQEIENLSSPLFRWLDFRLRYIEPIPRKIVASNKFPKKLPLIVETGFQLLVEKLRNGLDVNPYQSKTLTRFNDTSSKRRSKRTDLLWADWGITHLHITDKPLKHGKYFYDRECSSGDSCLLFCMFSGDQVGLIDIRRHQDELVFSDLDLIKIVKESWPEYIEQFKLNGILPGTNFTNEEIDYARKGGVNSGIVLDDSVYMGPGMGVTSASTPLKVTLKANQLLKWVDQLADFACDESGFIQKEINLLGIKKPKFELCITAQGFAIYEVECLL